MEVVCTLPLNSRTLIRSISHQLWVQKSCQSGSRNMPGLDAGSAHVARVPLSLAELSLPRSIVPWTALSQKVPGAIKNHRPHCPPRCCESFFRRPWDSLFHTAATVGWDLHLFCKLFNVQLWPPSSSYQTLIATEGIVFVKYLCVCVCVYVYDISSMIDWYMPRSTLPWNMVWLAS